VSVERIQDNLSVEKETHGLKYRLLVSIADVSEYVKE